MTMSLHTVATPSDGTFRCVKEACQQLLQLHMIPYWCSATAAALLHAPVACAT